MSGLDIAPEHLKIVRDILCRHLPDREVRTFGSRVNGLARPFSDLDLAIMGEVPLPLSLIAALAEAFSESDLPFKVDLVDWAAISPQFRQIIAEKYLLLEQAD
jgi:type I restriction enzyme S subunit